MTEAEELPLWLTPKPRKTLLYLDQCILSDIAKVLDPESKRHERANQERRLRNAYAKIERLVKMQLLLCPMSWFHHAESVPSRDPSYLTLHDVGEYLSDGCLFEDMVTMLRFQLHAAFVARQEGNRTPDLSRRDVLSGDPNAWMERWTVRVQPQVGRDAKAKARDLRTTRELEMGRLHEEWRGSAPQPSSKASVDEIEGYRAALVEAVTWRRASSRAARRDLETPQKSAPFPALYEHVGSVVPEPLLEEEEAEKGFADALAFLRSDRLDDVPMISLFARLWPALRWKRHHEQRKAPPGPGTEVDLSVIASLLPYCDAMVLDTEMATMLSQDPGLQPFMERYRTRVFARNKSGLAELISFLDAVEQSATPEHMDMLARAYGDLDSWLKPFGVVEARRSARRDR